MPAKTEITNVLIVGAGPTGLMLANWLARLSVDCVLIDAKSGPTRQSRALGVQARTMEIYDQLGLVDHVLKSAYVAEGVAPGFEDQAFGFIQFANIGSGVSPYPRLYILEQSRNEEILYANLQRLGGEVLFQHRLEELQEETADDGGSRVIATLQGPDGRMKRPTTSSSIRPMLEKVFGVTYESTSWFSTYNVHHRVAARFRDGPVLLAGDAGHVHSPVGAQGMNTGLQDSHNLAFKLAAVLIGEAPPSYLDRYAAERRPVA